MNDIYNNCLITLDENKYSFRYLENIKGISGTELVLLSSYMGNNDFECTYCFSNFGAMISDNENGNNLFFVPNPDMILQVSDDEFLVSFRCSLEEFQFQHLYYNRDEFSMNVKYVKKYSSVDFGNIRLKNNLVIIEEDDNVTIYNYKTSKNLELGDIKIIDSSLLDDNSCVLCKIDIRERETIIFAVNSELLEFDSFYSKLQNRYIKVIDDKEIGFSDRFTITLENEIYKYLEYIEEYEEFMINKKIDRVCKKLIKNNRV